jgi:hypothetical protein
MGDPSEGKLMAITLWGVLDAASKTWAYQWSGDDLIRIDRPDGRALLFEYDDPGNPAHPDGYMTRAWLGMAKAHSPSTSFRTAIS